MAGVVDGRSQNGLSWALAVTSPPLVESASRDRRRQQENPPRQGLPKTRLTGQALARLSAGLDSYEKFEYDFIALESRSLFPAIVRGRAVYRLSEHLGSPRTDSRQTQT